MGLGPPIFGRPIRGVGLGGGGAIAGGRPAIREDARIGEGLDGGLSMSIAGLAERGRALDTGGGPTAASGRTLVGPCERLVNLGLRLLSVSKANGFKEAGKSKGPLAGDATRRSFSTACRRGLAERLSLSVSLLHSSNGAEGTRLSPKARQTLNGRVRLTEVFARPIDQVVGQRLCGFSPTEIEILTSQIQSGRLPVTEI